MVELLVGVAIALIGMVIMFQVMENSENRKRTTASGSDAQIAGSIAMHLLERDLRLAGNGFGSSAGLGCTVNAYDTVRGAAFTFPMTPIQIVDGGGGAPDQLIVLYGNSPVAGTGYTFNNSSATTKKMDTTSSRAGLQRGDLLFVVGTSCGMIEVTDNTDADQLTINHVSGAYNDTQGVATTSRFNAPTGFTIPSGQLFSLGFRDVPRRNSWQINNGRTLTVTDDLHFTDAFDQTVTPAAAGADGQNDFQEVGDGIIDLQAQYGLDTDGDFMADTWQVAAPASWQEVIAVRIALLARSQHFEKIAVTNAAPGWAAGNFVMTNLDGSPDSTPGDANDWRHYRYRVYQTAIPLRNVIWGITP